jgi:hypothetical protein
MAILRCVEAACRAPHLEPAVPRVKSLSASARSAAVRMLVDAFPSAADAEQLTHLAVLADQVGGERPDAEIRLAAIECGRLGAVNLADVLATPAPYREPLLAGTLAGLEIASAETMASVLTAPVCSALADRDLHTTPRIALVVLADVGRRTPKRRVECSRKIAALRDVAQAPALRQIWVNPPTPRECLEIFGLPKQPVKPTSLEVLALCSRSWAFHGVEGAPAVALARRLQEFPGVERPSGAVVDSILVLGLASLEGRDQREAEKGARTIEQFYPWASEDTARRVLQAVAEWIQRVPVKAVRAVGPSLRKPLQAYASTKLGDPMSKAIDRIDGVPQSRLRLFRRQS